jgi:hypothetical protein
MGCGHMIPEICNSIPDPRERAKCREQVARAIWNAALIWRH